MFGKRQELSIDDPDFGPITQKKPNCWTGEQFQLWEYNSIQVLINAGPQGSSEEQRSFLHSLREDDGIRTRITAAVAEYAKETTHRKGALRISSIYLPASPLHEKWRIWFDMDGEDHFWYGAEMEGWKRMLPFAQD